MRLFLGFPVPDPLSLELIGVRDQAMQRMSAVRPLPVVAGNFHMTLIFLGEVTASRMEQIVKGAEQFCSGQPAVRLQLPGELAKHAMSEGAKAVARASS